MAATEIILKKGWVLLTQTSTQLAISFVGNAKDFQNGEVAQVSDLENEYEVGDVVTYNPEGAQNLSYGSVAYVLTTTDKILYTEGNPP